MEQERLDRIKQRYEYIEPELHASFTHWAEHHADKSNGRRSPLPYAPDIFPEQSLTQAVTLAYEPSPRLPDWLYYSALRYKVGKSIGHLATTRFLHELAVHPASKDDSTPLANAMVKAQQEGQNTIVITPHFSIEEIGYFKALRFLVKRDRSRIHQNGILLNKLMTRQSYRAKPIVDHFRPLGDVYWSIPKSKSANRWNVPLGGMLAVNAFFKHELDKALVDGGLELDVALTGSEIEKTFDENENQIGYRFPTIETNSVRLIPEFDNLFSAALLQHPQTQAWKMYLGELRSVPELLQNSSPEEITDQIFTNFQREIASFTGKAVEYRKVAGRLDKLALDER